MKLPRNRGPASEREDSERAKVPVASATSTDGLTFGTRSVAIPPSSAGIICDPSPITVGANSTNGTTWTCQTTAVGLGADPGMVREEVRRVVSVWVERTSGQLDESWPLV